MGSLAETPLTTLAADFIATLGDPRDQGSTARAYRDDLRQLLGLLEARQTTRLSEVTREELRGALAALPRKYAVATRRRRVSALQSFFRYLADERGWSTNPARGLKRPPRIEPVPRAYPWSTVDAILAATQGTGRLDVRNRCLMAVWFYAGLRLRESLTLDWPDISTTEQTIRVRRGKGGKSRLVSFGPALAAHLAAHRELVPDATGAVFLGHRGSRMDAKAVYAMIRRYGLFERYELTPHRARHTHLTELLRRGTNMRTLQKRAGHQDLRSTMVYLTVFDSDERDAGNALG